MKKNFGFPSQDIFKVKLISCIVFASASGACCLSKSVAIILYFLNKDNLINSQLYYHLLEQLRSFECYHMFLNYCLLLDRKYFVHRS